MDDSLPRAARKAATAARMYDYYLGGIHNFPADQEAADAIIKQFPFIPAAAKANRAFVVNAVRHVARSGVRQVLDIGSGIPTVDNVHSIVQDIHPDARVVYVDIDPVAVAESMEILQGQEHAVAVRGDARNPAAILKHPDVQRTLDFNQPICLLLAAVLHFLPDHEEAEAVVDQLVEPLAPGSALIVSHSATESFSLYTPTEDVYQRRTSTPGTIRTRAEVERLFTGLDLVPPGVVWAQEWAAGATRPESPPAQPGGLWVGVGVKG